MRRMLTAAVAVCCLLLSGCDSDCDVDPGALAGMSKKDVLRLVFRKCSADENGEIKIGIWQLLRDGGYQDLYFKSFNDAANDAVLMSSDDWEIAHKHRYRLSIPFVKEEGLRVFFDKGVVVRVGKSVWSD